MIPRITTTEAKRLSILKWKLIIDNNGFLKQEDKKNPELIDLKHYCGFCERWADYGECYSGYNSGCNCARCEYAHVADVHCNSELPKNLFLHWSREGDAPTKLKLAKRILKLIKSIPE